jgi:hypothetical protein
MVRFSKYYCNYFLKFFWVIILIPLMSCTEDENIEDIPKLAKTKIASVTCDDGNCEIYVSFPNADPLFTNTKIAFASYRNDDQGIYMINPNGKNEKLLITDLEWESNPSWSPHGTNQTRLGGDPMPFSRLSWSPFLY